MALGMSFGNLFWLKRGAKVIHVLEDMDIDPVAAGLGGRDVERVSCFLNVGGLAAVHAQDRSRDALWSAMKRGEVYGPSGHRMLLWFYLINADGSFLPMGSELYSEQTPSFKVRTVGSFKQQPGSPDYVVNALAAHHLEKCRWARVTTRRTNATI